MGRPLAGEIRQPVRGRSGPVLRAGLLDGQEQGADGQALSAIQAVPGKMGQCSPCGRRDLRRRNAGAGHCPHGECLYAGRRSGHFRGQRALYAGARRECLRADQFRGAPAGNAGGRGRNADDLRPHDHVRRNLPAFLYDLRFRVGAEIQGGAEQTHDLPLLHGQRRRSGGAEILSGRSGVAGEARREGVRAV